MHANGILFGEYSSASEREIHFYVSASRTHRFLILREFFLKNFACKIGQCLVPGMLSRNLRVSRGVHPEKFLLNIIGTK